MKVTLAGATIDRRFWKDDPAATPETISAAYARISHSPKTMGELRDIAVDQIEGARSSNENIIYRMGHSSVAEHAVFNLDIEDASRLLVEFIEHHRLASYTERSQRYVFFGDKELVIPKEIEDSEFREDVIDLERKKFDLYNRMVSDALMKEKYGDKLLEQARYVLGLTCPTDIGLTLNARELEYIIAQGTKHDLSEVRELSRALFDSCGDLAPSLIKYTSGHDHITSTRNAIADWMKGRKSKSQIFECQSCLPHTTMEQNVCCERPTAIDDPEAEIAAALMFEIGDLSFKEYRCIAREMSDSDLMDLFTPVFRNYPVHASLPRAFEMMYLTFDFLISASAFAQLKRHRMATLLVQGYDPDDWVTPQVYIENPDHTKDYLDLMRESSVMFSRIKKEMGQDVASYVLTNAHRRRVVFKVNLRELYHFVRLRSDQHAQDEIREISNRMVCAMKEHFPLVTSMLCGKDTYDEGKKRILGCSSEKGGE